MKRDDLYKLALQTFGKTTQIHKLLEEMSELQKAVLKEVDRINPNPKLLEMDRIFITDEIADVEIMLEQTKLIYNITPESLMVRKKFKKKRLENRIKDQKQD